MRQRLARALAMLVGFASFPACGMLSRHASPQQQFMQAVQRGNSAQASQIWLNMNAEDRANFAHGIGFKPENSAADLTAQVERHQQGATATPDATGRPESDDQSQTVEYPELGRRDLHAGDLKNLLKLEAQSTGSPPEPPSADAP